MLENILQLAKSLEVEITAEGVETAEQLAFFSQGRLPLYSRLLFFKAP